MNTVILKAKGVRQINRQEAIDLGVALRTESYTPITNKEIIETALEQVYKQGLKIKDEFYKTDGSRSKFVGGFTINSGNSEMDMFWGFKNSIDKSMSASYASGGKIFICSNSAVSGEFTLTRKHTGEADKHIKIAISEGIQRLGDKFRKIELDFQRMKEIEVTKKTVSELVGRLYLDNEIITAHQLSIIKGEINLESYDYGVKDSLFNLYQAVTHSLKTSHPISWLNDHVNAHQFFVEESNLILT